MQRYPRSAVETVRRAARAGAEAELARSEQALARAKVQAEVVDHACAEQRAKRRALPSGPELARAFELQRSAAFACRQIEETQRLSAELQATREQVAALERSLALARRTLAEALAAERLVERDRQRFVAAELRERERAEQDEIDELARSGRA